jgi:hypothetical protein
MPKKDDAKRLSWQEFECPECTAHNIVGDGFTFGDEVFCSWCGQVFLVRKTDDGERFKLVLN